MCGGGCRCIRIILMVEKWKLIFHESSEHSNIHQGEWIKVANSEWRKVSQWWRQWRQEWWWWWVVLIREVEVVVKMEGDEVNKTLYGKWRS